ncbi:splicing factor U2af large subunit B [Citrus sinensis]|uniref:Splicing factor U2af large subunit B n=1 Tax=Citrus sinensis TaxID=2711 RepID=A0ACB8J1J2_CITSI|nr:splicing factor U2af large subunit B [Citrus sinensis]
MADYEVNGEDVDNNNNNNNNNYEYEKEKEKGRDRDRDRDRDRTREKDRDREKNYDRDREDRHKRRSQSRSRGRSEHRSRSRSRSRSKSKRISGFDMAPPASAMLAAGAAAAAAGQIPGANPAIPGMFPNMFPLATGQFGALPVMPVQAMTQQATRHARRVYVGGLPPTANEQSVATFFSQVMAAIGGNTAGPGDAVVNVYINHEKKFAFVEMRSVEEASNAMALDGIIFEGAPVKVRRPSDYNPSLAATLGPSQPNPNLNLAAVGLTPGSAGGLEGPDRIFVGGLPYYFTEAQIRELLESFGPLRGFDLVKDRETGNSKGYAFCVYQDLSVTDIACAALNGIKMGDKTLTVRRANQGANQPKPEQESVLLHAQQQIALQRLMLQPGSVPSKVVYDEEYEEILEDMRQEGGKFGTLVNVIIPRPNPNGEPSPGVGKVFLEYADIDGATKARTGMNGRKFGGNQVVAVFYPENKFAQGDYEG